MEFCSSYGIPWAYTKTPRCTATSKLHHTGASLQVFISRLLWTQKKEKQKTKNLVLGLREFFFSIVDVLSTFKRLPFRSCPNRQHLGLIRLHHHHYLIRKELQTLQIDKTENEELSACLFPVIILGLLPINISAIVPEGDNAAERAREKILGLDNLWIYYKQKTPCLD